MSTIKLFGATLAAALAYLAGVFSVMCAVGWSVGMADHQPTYRTCWPSPSVFELYLWPHVDVAAICFAMFGIVAWLIARHLR